VPLQFSSLMRPLKYGYGQLSYHFVAFLHRIFLVFIETHAGMHALPLVAVVPDDGGDIPPANRLNSAAGSLPMKLSDTVVATVACARWTK
jgi:hypothetical protein